MTEAARVETSSSDRAGKPKNLVDNNRIPVILNATLREGTQADESTDRVELRRLRDEQRSIELGQSEDPQGASGVATRTSRGAALATAQVEHAGLQNGTQGRGTLDVTDRADDLGN